MPDTTALTADFHRLEIHPPGTPFTGLGTLAVGVITIAALYFGREVFVSDGPRPPSELCARAAGAAAAPLARQPRACGHCPWSCSPSR